MKWARIWCPACKILRPMSASDTMDKNWVELTCKECSMIVATIVGPEYGSGLSKLSSRYPLKAAIKEFQEWKKKSLEHSLEP